MRRQILSKAADLMMERQQDIAGLVTEETGSVFGWGMFNVQLAAGMLREAAAQAYNLVGEVIPSDVPGKLAMGVRQPAGVVVAIAPWNAPVILSTAAAASFGAFFHQGQICMSTERVVADRSVADALPGKLAERARALPIGDPRDAGTAIGPLINRAAIERVSGLVEDAVSKGANALSGGDADRPCFPPTVLTGVTPEMRIYGEESFGPIVTVIPVDGPDEAAAVANDTEYGLSAAVFSADVPAALEEFTELRWITVQSLPRQYPI